jgi:hypothetical protein
VQGDDRRICTDAALRDGERDEQIGRVVVSDAWLFSAFRISTKRDRARLRWLPCSLVFPERELCQRRRLIRGHGLCVEQPQWKKVRICCTTKGSSIIAPSLEQRDAQQYMPEETPSNPSTDVQHANHQSSYSPSHKPSSLHANTRRPTLTIAFYHSVPPKPLNPTVVETKPPDACQVPNHMFQMLPPRPPHWRAPTCGMGQARHLFNNLRSLIGRR